MGYRYTDMRSKIFFLLAGTLSFSLISGCRQPEAVVHPGFFDFHTFFNGEINELIVGDVGLVKTIVDGEKVLSNVERKPDWKKELEVFKSFSLIKPEQTDLYDVDTLKTEHGFIFVSYSAKTNKPELQLAEVMFNPTKEIEKVTLVVKSDEKISVSDITLTYLPGKGYDIKGDIDSKIAGLRMIDIHVECTNR
jgi:hypothetical protein